MLLALLLRNGVEQGEAWLLQPGSVNSCILLGQIPFHVYHSATGKACLIAVDRTERGLLRLRQQLFHRCQLLSCFGGINVLRLLEQSVLLALDLVLLVNPAEQRRVHRYLRKLFSEVLATICQRSCRLPLERGAACQPLDLLLIQEPDAVLLSRFLILSLLEAFQKG